MSKCNRADQQGQHEGPEVETAHRIIGPRPVIRLSAAGAIKPIGRKTSAFRGSSWTHCDDGSTETKTHLGRYDYTTQNEQDEEEQ